MKYLIFLWVNIISINTQSRYEPLLPINRTNTKQFICLKAFLEFARDERSIFLHANVTDTLDELGYLITRLGSHIRNFHLPDYLQFGRFTYFAFLITDQVYHIKAYILAMLDTIRFLSDTKYFIVYLGNEDLHSVFAVTWIVYSERVIVMDKNYNFYTPEPFRVRCGKNERYDYIFNCDTMNFSKIYEIYNFTYTTFYGCDVKVLTVPKEPFVINPRDPEHPGVEIEIFNMIARKYNFTPVYLDHKNKSWGAKLSNGKFRGMLKRLHNREGDVMFGNFFTNSTFIVHFQVSYPYIQSDLAFYVPTEQLRNNWNAGIHVFKLYVWLMSIAMVCVMYISLNIFTTTLERKAKIKTVRYTILETLGIFLGKAVHQPNVTILRTLFIICVICSYIISTSYETRLLSFLVKPAKVRGISTDQEVIASGIRFGGMPFAKDLFAKPNTYFYKTYINCPPGTYCLNRTAFKKDMATLDNTAYTKYFMHHYLDEDGRKLLRQIATSYSFFSWIAVNKGFPILSSINDTIVQLCDHGLMEMMFRRSTKPTIPMKDKTDHSLGIGQMLMYFYILIVGDILSCIVFLFELKFKDHYYFFG